MKPEAEVSHAATINIVQCIIDFIEENIMEPLTPAELAKRFFLSVSVFNNLFRIVCDMSVMEYIRNRRLTLAGQELMATDIRIIDMSMKYGYETPEAFSKAFTRFHGYPPSLIRRVYPEIMIFDPLQVTVERLGGWQTKQKPLQQEIQPAHGYNGRIKPKGASAMGFREQAYEISTKDMAHQGDWKTLLLLARKLDRSGIAFKVDGRTMIFAHGLEFKLEKICLSIRWNDERKVMDFFHFDGESKETYPGFKYFDVLFEGMKIRCMYFKGPGYEADGFLFRDTDAVRIDGQILHVQSLEFFLNNAEPDSEHYRLVDDYMKARNITPLYTGDAPLPRL